MQSQDPKHSASESGVPQALALTLRVSPALSRLLVITVAALLTWIGYLLLGDHLRTAEERLGSVSWTMAPDTQLEERITIVAIDEKSLAEVGPWPWPREVLADLVGALDAAEVSLQLYDIVFPESKAGDELLQAALLNTPSVIAQIPLLQSEQSLQGGVMTHGLAGVRCQSPLPSTRNYLASNPAFAAVPKGHITPLVDMDGMVRQQPPLVCVEGKVYPSLALSALLSVVENGATGKISLQSDSGLLSPPWMLRSSNYPGLEIPLDSQGNMRISYAQAPSSYQVVSAVDLLQGKVDPALLRNTWVLVGATAFGLGDVVPTPHSGLTPGVELQARVLASLLDNSVPYTPRLSPLMLTLLGLLFAGILYQLATSRTRVGTIGLPLMGLLLPLAAYGLHLQLVSSNIWLGWLAPSSFALIAAALLALLEHGRVRMERMRVYNNLSSYLPGVVAEGVAFNLPTGAVEVERKELTLLCADLRNFSAYEESRPPEESAALLHCFFVRATEIIEHHGGSVHEFKGDSVLAMWSGADDAGAQASVAAAHQLQRMVEEMFLSQPPAGLEPLALGVSIEQGPALIGSIGPAHRRTHTLLGDTVTITLRIQEMTQELAQPILIGECAARRLSGEDIESQGGYLLSGLRIPHTLFAPVRSIEQGGEVADDKVGLKVLRGGRH